MKITKIEWVSTESQEATVTVSDDSYSVEAFCLPCKYKAGDVLKHPLSAYEPTDMVTEFGKTVGFERIGHHFEYRITGHVADKRSTVKVGEIAVAVGYSVPGDVKDGDLVSFKTLRLDCC